MKKIYILGLRSKLDDHYGLTSWYSPVNKPMLYGIYTKNPGYWDNSKTIEPIAVSENEKDLLEKEGWNWIGFGWEV